MMMNAFKARLATWRQSRVSLRELSRLSDRDLEDLGIGRADIRAVASGAPVMTSEEVDVVVASRLVPLAADGLDTPIPAWTAYRPVTLAA